jgi:hypothetical protein
LAGRAETGASFDHLLSSFLESINGNLFLSGYNLDLENYVAPTEFDWILAQFFRLFDQLLGVNRFSRSKRFSTSTTLSMDLFSLKSS